MLNLGISLNLTWEIFRTGMDRFGHLEDKHRTQGSSSNKRKLYRYLQGVPKKGGHKGHQKWTKDKSIG